MAIHGNAVHHRPEVGTYVIDPAQSAVRFRIRNFFGLVVVRGTFAVSRGEVVVADPATSSTVEAVISAASIDTGNEKRDTHVREAAFLDVATHAEMHFRGERVEAGDEAHLLHGRLTVRGISKPAALTLDTVSGDERRLVVHAVTTVDRYAFGVTKGKGSMGRHLTLDLDVVAERR
ncbi:YceI family protein [Streptomyces griseiscabiei]|uniref:YceI family protein n=1 Tax=Streptomyces griseiscabiei TaxID=2993540 RepID=A0ABU4L6N6_9ACTN|nr:YceI family protein [Streptomyces griseiscabiei]MBZ3906416.1 YceI family protein [Streptomyces griseiscabiei]MDX2911411.1 YceI family protein [Streptomyces griseiscabiei]